MQRLECWAPVVGSGCGMPGFFWVEGAVIATRTRNKFASGTSIERNLEMEHCLISFGTILSGKRGSTGEVAPASTWKPHEASVDKVLVL